MIILVSVSICSVDLILALAPFLFLLNHKLLLFVEPDINFLLSWQLSNNSVNIFLELFRAQVGFQLLQLLVEIVEVEFPLQLSAAYILSLAQNYL